MVLLENSSKHLKNSYCSSTVFSKRREHFLIHFIECIYTSIQFSCSAMSFSLLNKKNYTFVSLNTEKTIQQNSASVECWKCWKFNICYRLTYFCPLKKMSVELQTPSTQTVTLIWKRDLYRGKRGKTKSPGWVLIQYERVLMRRGSLSSSPTQRETTRSHARRAIRETEG